MGLVRSLLQADPAQLGGRNLSLFCCFSRVGEVSRLTRDASGEREGAGGYSWGAQAGGEGVRSGGCRSLGGLRAVSARPGWAGRSSGCSGHPSAADRCLL